MAYPKNRTLVQLLAGSCLVAATLVPSGFAVARKLTVLHSFKDGTDGGVPRGRLIVDTMGNLYGTAVTGGTGGSGVVFKLAPDGAETVLHSFSINDGASPEAGLLQDARGNYYSTTFDGGANGVGTVFKLAPGGTLTVLYSFCNLENCADGSFTYSGVIGDAAGDLYGTTVNGGDANCNCGVVFELTPHNSYTVLHAFTNTPDGAVPGELIADKKQNLYGMTSEGGANRAGAIFKIKPNGTETLLYSFDGAGGNFPTGGLVADKSGYLYGATYYGGAYSQGVIFKFAPNGTETPLYSFTGGTDGAGPDATLTLDSEGNLFGTTQEGGNANCNDGEGCGTLFKLAPEGTLSVLHAFRGGRDGEQPAGGVIKQGAALYGTTPAAGADGYGNVFTIK